MPIAKCQAFLPTVRLTAEQFENRKKWIDTQLCQNAARINPAIENFGSSRLRLGYDMSRLHRLQNEYAAMENMVRSVCLSGVQSPHLISSLRSKHNELTNALINLRGAIASNFSMSDSNFRQQLVSEAQAIDNFYTAATAGKIGEFLASIRPDMLTLDAEKFTIKLPPFLMANDTGIKACFDMKVVGRIRQQDNGSLKVLPEDIHVQTNSRNFWCNASIRRTADGYTWEERGENAPHVQSSGSVCLGNNAEQMDSDARRDEYGPVFQALLNCIDLYNEASPYATIESGIGTFCDLTGSWTRVVATVPQNGINIRVCPEILNVNSNIRPGEYKYRHICALPEVAPILDKVRSRVVWCDAIDRIGRPRRGEFFLETGRQNLMEVRNSWLGQKGMGFKVFKYEGDCSDGDKIILKKDWFDIAYYELSASIQKFFIESNARLGRTELPDYIEYKPKSFEESQRIREEQEKAKETAEQKAKALLDAMETSKKKRLPKAITVVNTDEGQQPVVVVANDGSHGTAVQALVDAAIERGATIQMPHGNATLFGFPAIQQAVREEMDTADEDTEDGDENGDEESENDGIIDTSGTVIEAQEMTDEQRSRIDMLHRLPVWEVDSVGHQIIQNPIQQADVIFANQETIATLRREVQARIDEASQVRADEELPF